jgi:hypothetical protein
MIINKPKNQAADYYDNLALRFRDVSVVYDRKQLFLPFQHLSGNSDCFVMYNEKKIDLNCDRLPSNALFLSVCGVTYRSVYTGSYYANCKLGRIENEQWLFGQGLKYGTFNYNVNNEDFKERWGKNIFDFKFSLEMHHIFNAPILAIAGDSLLINPNLKALDFQKVLNAQQVFTELSNFIGGVLTHNAKIIEVADKYKIEQHGFTKYSFRNPTKLKDLT